MRSSRNVWSGSVLAAAALVGGCTPSGSATQEPVESEPPTVESVAHEAPSPTAGTGDDTTFPALETVGAAPGPQEPRGPVVEGATFSATFDTPEDFFDRFDRQVLHGADEVTVEQWHGDHNGACEGPNTTRPVAIASPDDMSQLFWWCAPKGPESGHVMTSMNTTGYAQVDFSPRQVFDRVSKVCWDQNLSDLGGRKWTQVAVIPESHFQANDGRLDYVRPDLQNDVGSRGVPLEEGDFLFVLLLGSTTVHVGQDVNDWDDANIEHIEGFDASDKATRYRHCITDLEDGTVQIELFGRRGPDDVEVRILDGSFTNEPARVIFQDDSYDPPKDVPALADPFTWHWDNIEIA